ncbi:MAG: sigma-70 family RNA polymerase sigma factor [Candidatus Hydrogenedentes bacterium]|nr:sigma-70 family RNA polymerase sigma factor [Candidatus Hydrogenedentota bacterium]
MDKARLQDLCKQYSPRLAAFFQRNAVPSSEVADLVQECFVVLCRRHDSVSDRKAGQFLYGIARNLLMAHRRKANRAAAQLACFTRESAHSNMAAPADNPRDRAAQQMENEKLLAAVENLADRQKKVIRLVYFKNLSRAEAAREMGVTWQTLHIHEQVALERLRGILTSAKPSAGT